MSYTTPHNVSVIQASWTRMKRPSRRTLACIHIAQRTGESGWLTPTWIDRGIMGKAYEIKPLCNRPSTTFIEFMQRLLREMAGY